VRGAGMHVRAGHACVGTAVSAVAAVLLPDFICGCVDGWKTVGLFRLTQYHELPAARHYIVRRPRGPRRLRDRARASCRLPAAALTYPPAAAALF